MDKMNREIANTIWKQLGGNRFKMMTGAKNLAFCKDYFSFRLPTNFARDNINYVEIALNSMDTYDVHFYKLNTRSGDKKQLASTTGIYDDMLQSEFKRITGLDTRIGGL